MYHKTSGFKKHKFIVLYFWSLKSEIEVSVTLVSPEGGKGEICLMPLSQLWQFADHLWCSVASATQLHSFYSVLPECVSVSKFPLSIRHQSYWIRCLPFSSRLLRVPWTARRSNQSILKEINPEYSLEGLMLKLQYFGHLMRRANSLEKTLMLGKIEGKKRRGQQRMRWLDSITDSMDMNLSKLSTLFQYALFLTNCIYNQIRPYFQRRSHSQILGKYVHPSIHEWGKGHNPTNNTVLPCFYQYIFLISSTSYLYP